MPKGKSHPEFFIAFHSGLKPNDLIARGYPKWSVYNYHRRYVQKIQPAFLELMKRPEVQQSNNDRNSSDTVD